MSYGKANACPLTSTESGRSAQNLDTGQRNQAGGKSSSCCESLHEAILDHNAVVDVNKNSAKRFLGAAATPTLPSPITGQQQENMPSFWDKRVIGKRGLHMARLTSKHLQKSGKEAALPVFLDGLMSQKNIHCAYEGIVGLSTLLP